MEFQRTPCLRSSDNPNLQHSIQRLYGPTNHVEGRTGGNENNKKYSMCYQCITSIMTNDKRHQEGSDSNFILTPYIHMRFLCFSEVMQQETHYAIPALVWHSDFESDFCFFSPTRGACSLDPP